MSRQRSKRIEIFKLNMSKRRSMMKIKVELGIAIHSSMAADSVVEECTEDEELEETSMAAITCQDHQTECTVDEDHTVVDTEEEAASININRTIVKVTIRIKINE